MCETQINFAKKKYIFNGPPFQISGFLFSISWYKKYGDFFPSKIGQLVAFTLKNQKDSQFFKTKKVTKFVKENHGVMWPGYHTLSTITLD